jgi:hypothetical protein
MEEVFAFEGFGRPNYTPVPDELFDCLLPSLTGAELKVLLYITRRTWGFKRETDVISREQLATGIVGRDGRRLDGGTGLSHNSVSAALTTLVGRGVIVATSQPGAPTSYSLRLRHQRPTPKIGATPTPKIGGDNIQRQTGTNREKEDVALRRSRRRQLPDDFTLTEGRRQYAQDKGIAPPAVAERFSHFLEHHRSRGSTMLDWDAAWRTWVLRERSFVGRPGQRRSDAVEQSLQQLRKIAKEEFGAT